METALGHLVAGRISVDPGASVLALGQYLSVLAVAFLSAAVAVDRHRAETVLFALPSRPGEFHPEPLTDPDMTLSCHPARATARRLPPSVENLSSSRYRLALSQRR